MDVMYQIVNNIEQRDYIRMYPFWYKELNRNPERYQDFVNEIETLKNKQRLRVYKNLNNNLTLHN